MTRITNAQLANARPVLEDYLAKLKADQAFDAGEFETGLREALTIGRKEVGRFVIDLLKHHERYKYVAAYFMEHDKAAFGAEDEFKIPLAQAYGISNYGSNEREAAAKKFWSKAPRE